MRHRCVGTIVRNTSDDRESRAAVRAVDQRVSKTLILRIKQIMKTRGADRRIDCDVRVPSSVFLGAWRIRAWLNRETFVFVDDSYGLEVDLVKDSQGRPLGLEIP